MTALRIRYSRCFARLQWTSIMIAWLVPYCVAGLPSEGQILTTPDLQNETYEAASRRAEPPQMPPVQAGRVWSNLGRLYQDAAKYSQAQAAYEHAMRLLMTPPVSQPDLAFTIDRLGTLYLQTGNFNEAEQAELHALKIRQAAGLESQLPQSWYHLANLYLREHHPAKAEDFARRAAQAFSNDTNSAPEDKIGSLLILASSECQSRRYPEAIAQFQTALAFSRKTYGPDRFPTGLNMFLLGYAYWKKGDAASAREPLEQGYTVIGREMGWHPAYLFFMARYAHFLRDQHQHDQARAVMQEMKQKRNQLNADPALHDRLQAIDVAAFF